MTTALFFDLDGTLTDPKPGITRSVQYALERLGVAVPTEEELTWCIGPPLLESFRQLVGDAQAQAGAIITGNALVKWACSKMSRTRTSPTCCNN